MSEKRDHLQAWWNLRHGRLEPDERVSLPVLSGSMRPWLAPGTEIRIRPATWCDCRQGDIAVFLLGESLTAHRVLLRLSIGRCALLYQKGDLNALGRWTFGRHVIGRVEAATGDDGRRRDFTSRRAEDEAARLASESLRRDIINRLLAPPRRILSWLRRT